MEYQLRLKIWRNSIVMRQKKIQLRYFMDNQTDEKYEIKYKEYIFEEASDEKFHILYIIDKIECIVIIIDKEDHIAEVQCIGTGQTYMNENEINDKLKITLKMLQKYKEKLDINKILLSDNTFKKCSNKKIELPTMLTLLTGDTWYGKYGFRPNEEFFIKKYENNKKIINTITLKDIDLIKYLKMSKLDKQKINEIKQFIEENDMMLLKDYLIKFVKKYDRIYKYFYDFYFTLFYDLRLYDFHRNIFELSI